MKTFLYHTYDHCGTTTTTTTTTTAAAAAAKEIFSVINMYKVGR